MKIFTAVLLFAVMLGSKIEVDAGGFNLSGYFDPGISIGNNQGRHKIYQARNSKNHHNDSDWPQPIHINDFEEPDSSNDPIHNETDSNDNEHPQRHKHRSHHRAHRH